jgi:hypothetical protein
MPNYARYVEQRGKTAYTTFVKSVFKQIHVKGTSASLTNCRLGKMWAEMPINCRKNFIALSKNEWDDYLIKRIQICSQKKSLYNMFIIEKYPYFRKKFPTLRNTEVFQKVAEDWQKYKNVYNANQQQQSFDLKKIINFKPLIKRPLNPYLCFARREIPKLTKKMNFIEASKQTSLTWKEMREEEKMEYLEESKQRSIKWKAYRESMGKNEKLSYLIKK